ncbi:MAG: methyltransferase domain-containing protein [Chloroflexi bacterium]|nr:methyltransferase domain-containing protein [Chloroflexota bacterium]
MKEERTPNTSQWDAHLYDAKHAFVWKYGAGLVEMLAPKAGERILDIGCGTGHLTAQIAEADAEVTGIDSGPDMIAQARRGYPALQFEVADATKLRYEDEFDAVFSNAALHWMKPPEHAVTGMWRALRPGGRLVAEFGGRGNVQTIAGSLGAAIESVGVKWRSPWYFPSAEEYTNLLTKQGFEVKHAALTERPTHLEGGADGLRLWLQMFGGVFFEGLSEEQRTAVTMRVEEELRPVLFRDGIWVADYVRLRVVALKPS